MGWKNGFGGGSGGGGGELGASIGRFWTRNSKEIARFISHSNKSPKCRKKLTFFPLIIWL